jgi:hypothetical protein
MTNRQRRASEYIEAIEKLVGEGHCCAVIGRNGTSYIFDSFGNRYLATHYPKFNHDRKVKPFVNNLEETNARNESEKRLSARSN